MEVVADATSSRERWLARLPPHLRRQALAKEARALIAIQERLAHHLREQDEAKHARALAKELWAESVQASEQERSSNIKEPAAAPELPTHASAATVVANTYELAENIICHLDLAQALACTLACKKFKNVVETSLVLHRALRPTVNINDTPVKGHVFAPPVWPTCITQISIDYTPWWPHRQASFLRSTYGPSEHGTPAYLFIRVKLPYLNAARLRYGEERERQHSWRVILVTQPPITHIHFAQTRKRLTSRCAPPQCECRHVLVNENGITLGDIVDKAEEMFVKRANKYGELGIARFAFFASLKHLLAGEDERG